VIIKKKRIPPICAAGAFVLEPEVQVGTAAAALGFPRSGHAHSSGVCPLGRD
jgi:hypothetical protein